MIRYNITLTELETLIDSERLTWRPEAKSATQYFDANGAYSEPPKDPAALKPFWGEIKQVYLRLQNHKCAYCESRPSSWTGYFAIDHFRPKGRVSDWPPADHEHHAEFAFASSQASAVGYHLLAHHPLNYVAACNECNVSKKRTFFPIARPLHNTSGADPIALLASELPYLIYPLGNYDDDPEDLITFNGNIPCAAAQTDVHKRRRANVTIELLGLEREDLLRERSEVIASLIDKLDDELTHQDAARAVARFQSPKSPHSSCARCFVSLYRQDSTYAKKLARYAKKHVASTVGKI
jgi:hypothetical protein